MLFLFSRFEVNLYPLNAAPLIVESVDNKKFYVDIVNLYNFFKNIK